MKNPKRSIFAKLLKIAFLKLSYLIILCLPVNAEVRITLSPTLNHTLSLQNLSNLVIANDGIMLKDVWLRGTVRLKASNQTLKFSKQVNLSNGDNKFSYDMLKNVMVYSSVDLRTYTEQFGILPADEFEYCVFLNATDVERSGNAIAEECTYGSSTSNELLTLISPNDKAKLNEFYPTLVWMANLSSVAGITYRLRLVELQQNQSAMNAVLRNKAMVDMRGIRTQMEVYPVTAQPLELWHHYAWKVEAFYNGLKIASSEAWSFCIVDDSILNLVPKHQDFIDIKRDNFLKSTYAVGELKLFYELSDAKNENLQIRLFDADNEEVNLHGRSKIALKYGDNKFVLKLNTNPKLKHLKPYKIRCITASNRNYDVDFIYINPDFLN
jgi:hypothetical protein